MKSSQPYTLLKYPARFTVVDLLHDLEAMGMDEDIIIKSYGEKSRHTDPPCLSMATYARIKPSSCHVGACAHVTLHLICGRMCPHHSTSYPQHLQHCNCSQ